jgi:hypothetical protein
MKKLTLLVLLMTAGCAGDRRIIFVTNTQVGARVGVDSRQVPELVVGYNRQEAALVPIYIGSQVKGDTTFNADIATIVQQARALALEARDSAAASWTAAGGGKAKITEAQTLLQKAVDESSQASLPLLEANEAAKGLKGLAAAPPAPQQAFAPLINYLNAEIKRPYVVSAFDREGKVFGTYNSKSGDRTDALSVIGTFSGNGKGKSGNAQVEASGNIAQYFATGMAAQLLAEKAGAAAISASPNAKTAAEAEAYVALEDTRDRRKELDDLLKKPLTTSPYTFKGTQYNTTRGLADAVAADKGSTVGTVRRKAGKNLDELIAELEKATQ